MINITNPNWLTHQTQLDHSLRIFSFINLLNMYRKWWISRVYMCHEITGALTNLGDRCILFITIFTIYIITFLICCTHHWHKVSESSHTVGSLTAHFSIIFLLFIMLMKDINLFRRLNRMACLLVFSLIHLFLFQLAKDIWWFRKRIGRRRWLEILLLN